MDVLTLSRLQFAVTTIYHFFFVPLTLGLSILVALMETLYVTSGRALYKEMARFWGKLFLINFAMGVVTGIVQEFQFGMNWSEFSRFVGDVFGAPLAIEALLAFFLESTFLGLWIFGWEKLSKRVHLLTAWLVAFGSNISALWILIANSFMQQPVGYVLRNGRAEMNDFFALVLNPNVQVQYPHVLFSGLTTASFFVLGISVYHLLRNSNLELFRRSFQIASVVAAAAVGMIILNGHAQAQHVAQIQPMKLATAEGLFHKENPASFSLLTIGDMQGRSEVFALRIPNALSLLAYNQLTGEVKGINDLQAEYESKFGPGDYVPPAWIIYWSFRAMVGAGFLMMALAAYALFINMSELIERKPRFFALFIPALFLPYLANSSGWVMTEVGRSPWAVNGLILLDQGVSVNVGVTELLISLTGFTLIYAVLMAADVYLLAKFARAGVAGRQEAEESALAFSPATG